MTGFSRVRPISSESMRAAAARAALPALAVLALVGVVAVAAGGSTPAGTGETRTPADVLFDTIHGLFPSRRGGTGACERRNHDHLRKRRRARVRAPFRLAACKRHPRARGGGCRHHAARGAPTAVSTDRPRERGSDRRGRTRGDARRPPRRGRSAACRDHDVRAARTCARRARLPAARSRDARGVPHAHPRPARCRHAVDPTADRSLHAGEVLAAPGRRRDEGRGDRRPRASARRAPGSRGAALGGARGAAHGRARVKTDLLRSGKYLVLPTLGLVWVVVFMPGRLGLAVWIYALMLCGI